MQLYKPFNFLTNELCDEIIQYAKNKNFKKGTTLGKNNVRKNRIVWYKESKHWQRWIDIFNKIESKIDWIQDPQISFYSPGEKYDWHVDTWPAYRTHIRHFSLTCELQSAPGGKLDLENKNFLLRNGQAIIFKPSDRHRAISPTRGERISFTIWAMAKNGNKVDRS